MADFPKFSSPNFTLNCLLICFTDRDAVITTSNTVTRNDIVDARSVTITPHYSFSVNSKIRSAKNRPH